MRDYPAYTGVGVKLIRFFFKSIRFQIHCNARISRSPLIDEKGAKTHLTVLLQSHCEDSPSHNTSTLGKQHVQACTVIIPNDEFENSTNLVLIDIKSDRGIFQ